MNKVELTAFFAGALRLALPVLMAAVGELVSERAGVLNLGLEGIMLTGAFAGALGAYYTGTAVVGVLAGVLAAVLFTAITSVFNIRLAANQLVVGLAANALALGVTSFAAKELLPQGLTSNLPSFGTLNIPGLSDIPIVGGALFGQSLLLYVGLAMVAVTLYVLSRTGWGLAVRAAGDDARAADQAGCPVVAVRWLATLWTGVMAGMGGVFLSVADIQGFTQNMTTGRGFLAIGAVIAGAWIGWRVVVACLIFGAAAALQFQAEGLGLNVPVAILVAGPYVLALLAVAGLAGRTRPPADLIRPFVRGA
jgi:general nucleoside transport system permease protein